jgi:hypothetical protein
MISLVESLLMGFKTQYSYLLNNHEKSQKINKHLRIFWLFSCLKKNYYIIKKDSYKLIKSITNNKTFNEYIKNCLLVLVQKEKKQ